MVQARNINIGAILILAMAIAPIAGPAASAQDSFAATIADLPWLKGLDETDNGFVFDTPGGRVAVAQGVTNADAADVAAAYNAALPNLGWRITSAQDAPFVMTVFVRGGEQLTMVVIERAGGGALANFTVEPQSSG